MINTLTLNPAIDKILYLGELVKNTTNRLREVTNTVGGKGTHVSMNLRVLGQSNRAFGLAYGTTGRAIIRDLAACGVEPCFVYREEQESRTNYLLVEDTNECTLIAEKGVTPSDEDTEELIALMKQHIQPGDSLVLSGDASNYPDPYIYNRIIRQLKDKNIRIFFDSSGDTLEKGLEESPFLIKPNLFELSQLCGRPLEGEAEIIDAMESLARHQIPVIAVSLGGDGAIVRMPDGYYKTTPPAVDIKNTIGCGDCFLAGLAYGFDIGLAPVEILRLATAVSSATAASPLSVGFDKALADSLLEKSIVIKLTPDAKK